MKQAEGQVRSEGKLLEITPLIHDAYGTPYSLPPVHYVIENWLVGATDEYPSIGFPRSFQTKPEALPGATNSAMYCSVSFLIRVSEDSPDMQPYVPEATEVDVQQVLPAQLSELIDEALQNPASRDAVSAYPTEIVEQYNPSETS